MAFPALNDTDRSVFIASMNQSMLASRQSICSFVQPKPRVLISVSCGRGGALIDIRVSYCDAESC